MIGWPRGGRPSRSPVGRAATNRSNTFARSARTPDLIVISAGFDAHRRDPLGNLNLVEAPLSDFHQAPRHPGIVRCGGRIVSVLEGGYDLDALARSVAAHVTARRSERRADLLAEGNRAEPGSARVVRPPKLLDAAYPAHTAIKLILDNHSAHISKETKAWLAEQPTGRFRIHLHAQARLLAQSRRGFLLQARPLGAAPYPRRIQTGAQGPHHGRHGRVQNRPDADSFGGFRPHPERDPGARDVDPGSSRNVAPRGRSKNRASPLHQHSAATERARASRS